MLFNGYDILDATNLNLVVGSVFRRDGRWNGTLFRRCLTNASDLVGGRWKEGGPLGSSYVKEFRTYDDAVAWVFEHAHVIV